MVWWLPLWVYLALGYYCFWAALNRIDYDAGVDIFLPVLSLIVGPPIFATMFVRSLLFSQHRPRVVEFVEIKVNPKTGEITEDHRHVAIWRTFREMETRNHTVH
jgi:hypothetical protein